MSKVGPGGQVVKSPKILRKVLLLLTLCLLETPNVWASVMWEIVLKDTLS